MFGFQFLFKCQDRHFPEYLLASALWSIVLERAKELEENGWSKKLKDMCVMRRGQCTKRARCVIVFCRLKQTGLKKLYAKVFEGKQSENHICSSLKWEPLVQAATNRSSTDRELDIAMKVAACVVCVATFCILAHAKFQGFNGRIQDADGRMRTPDQRGVVHDVMDNLRALFTFKSSSSIESDMNSLVADGSIDSPPVYDHVVEVMPLQPGSLFIYNNFTHALGIDA